MLAEVLFQTLGVSTLGNQKSQFLCFIFLTAFLEALDFNIVSLRVFEEPRFFKKKLHARQMAPPTCPTMPVSKTALQGVLMCVKYHPWHKRYWQTWLDIWGSELPGYLMHIHLLYPTGLARAPKLCHLATLQLPPKCIVTLIMQICILFPPIPALGACYYIKVEIRDPQRGTKWNSDAFLFAIICNLNFWIFYTS